MNNTYSTHTQNKTAFQDACKNKAFKLSAWFRFLCTSATILNKSNKLQPPKVLKKHTKHILKKREVKMSRREDEIWEENERLNELRNPIAYQSSCADYSVCEKALNGECLSRREDCFKDKD